MTTFLPPMNGYLSDWMTDGSTHHNSVEHLYFDITANLPVVAIRPDSGVCAGVMAIQNIGTNTWRIHIKVNIGGDVTVYTFDRITSPLAAGFGHRVFNGSGVCVYDSNHLPCRVYPSGYNGTFTTAGGRQVAIIPSGYDICWDRYDETSGDDWEQYVWYMSGYCNQGTIDKQWLLHAVTSQGSYNIGPGGSSYGSMGFVPIDVTNY